MTLCCDMTLHPLQYTWPTGLFFQNALVEYIGVCTDTNDEMCMDVFWFFLTYLPPLTNSHLHVHGNVFLRFTLPEVFHDRTGGRCCTGPIHGRLRHGSQEIWQLALLIGKHQKDQGRVQTTHILLNDNEYRSKEILISQHRCVSTTDQIVANYQAWFNFYSVSTFFAMVKVSTNFHVQDYFFYVVSAPLDSLTSLPPALQVGENWPPMKSFQSLTIQHAGFSRFPYFSKISYFMTFLLLEKQPSFPEVFKVLWEPCVHVLMVSLAPSWENNTSSHTWVRFCTLIILMSFVRYSICCSNLPMCINSLLSSLEYCWKWHQRFIDIIIIFTLSPSISKDPLKWWKIKLSMLPKYHMLVPCVQTVPWWNVHTTESNFWGTCWNQPNSCSLLIWTFQTTKRVLQHWIVTVIQNIVCISVNRQFFFPLYMEYFKPTVTGHFLNF